MTLFESCGTEKVPRLITGSDAAIMIDSGISSTGSAGTAESHVQEIIDSVSTSGK